MKVFIIFACLLVAVTCDHCYKNAKAVCGANGAGGDLENCVARYGKTAEHIHSLNEYLNMHISRSLQYLMMSSHFGNYQKERDGFKKLFRKLSDTTWDDAIDLIKYVTLRGEKAKLEPHYDSAYQDQSTIFQGEALEMTEIESLAKAVDIQKKLALKAHEIYGETNHHDPEMGSYVEDKFMHKHAETVRELVGYTNDLKRLITLDAGADQKSVAVGVWLLDEYLSKKL